MSLLDGTSNDGASDDSAAREALAGAADDKEPPEQELPPAPEPPKAVALEKPRSRRERAEEVVNGKLKELSENVARMSEGISARDRQIGELTGHLQALAQRQAYVPQQQYQPPPTPQLPDPEELERKAQEAIDRKDFTGYQRLTREASVAATLRAIQPVLAQRQQVQAPPADTVPPALMPYFAAYPDVASHPAAMQLLAAKNVELEARGFRAGPERVRQIFEDVRATLKGGQTPGAPAYSQSSAAVLAGTPTSRPAGGSSAAEGKPRVELTREERIFAQKAGFSEHDIATEIAKSHPDRILR